MRHLEAHDDVVGGAARKRLRSRNSAPVTGPGSGDVRRWFIVKGWGPNNCRMQHEAVCHMREQDNESAALIQDLEYASYEHPDGNVNALIYSRLLIHPGLAAFWYVVHRFDSCEPEMEEFFGFRDILLFSEDWILPNHRVGGRTGHVFVPHGTSSDFISFSYGPGLFGSGQGLISWYGWFESGIDHDPWHDVRHYAVPWELRCRVLDSMDTTEQGVMIEGHLPGWTPVLPTPQHLWLVPLDS